jgi:endoglucanase
MKELIRTLVETYGPSGNEEQIRATIRAEIEDHADEVRVDPLGSLVAHKHGDGKRVLLAAHMDEIGAIVTYIDEKGFVRFTSIGGVRPLTCLGSRVVFEDGTIGVIGREQKGTERSKSPKLSELYIDVGASSRDDCPVGIGDAAVFSRPFVAAGPRLVSKAMDDRIGCAVLIEVLRRLKAPAHDVHVAFSVQEETSLSGARTSAYRVDPDVAISVDVTRTGDTPECYPMAVALGEGPAIKIQDSGMISAPAVVSMLERAAERTGIPYQREVLEAGTTDAAAMQLVRAGVPSGCVSIPCRYVHTPSEMVDERDVENAVLLLVETLQTP